MNNDTVIEIALRKAKKLPVTHFSYSDSTAKISYPGGSITALDGKLFRFMVADRDIYYYEIDKFNLRLEA